MKKNAFGKAFLTLALAGLLVGFFPLLHTVFPEMDVWVKPYPGIRHFLKPLPAGDTLAVASPLPATADTVVSDSVPPKVKAQFGLGKKAVVAPLMGTYEGINYLQPYFAALHERRGQIRIAYYGDSSIEGDLICMSFRDSLQSRYGGSGVGFVPIMSIHPGFRRSVHQAASNNWQRSVLGKRQVEGIPYGLSGEFFTPLGAGSGPIINPEDSTVVELDPSYWVSYKASTWFRRSREFRRVRLFYGRPKSGAGAPSYISVSANEGRKQFKLEPQKTVNELLLLDSSSQRLRINFQIPADLPLYGLSLESPQGIVVDNFPLRGSDGGNLRYITQGVLSTFQEALGYDLIILQFGLNVINADLQDYSWYTRKVEKVVKHFQEAMPGVPVLVVGVSDKASKINGRMQTDPSIPRITAAQRLGAERSGAAFFSLYEAMGGEGTMVRWVEEERPRLANLDYTHFNFKGARKISDLLIAFLDGHYMEYVVNDAPPM